MLSYIADLDKRMFYRIVDLSQRHGVYAWAKRISATGDGHVYLYLSVGLMLTHSQGQNLFNLLLASFLIELPLYILLKK